MSSPFLLLQLADSAFPTGGFAHSGGLEAAYQLGELDALDALARTIGQSLDQAGHAALPLVSAAHAAPDRLAELDRLCDAFTAANQIAGRASRAQGQAWLATAAAAFSSSDHPALGELRARCRREGLAGHLPPVFGAICRLLGVGLDDAQRVFLFSHLRGLIGSAVRLNLIGPLAAQGLQRDLGEQAMRVWERCRALGLEDLTQTAPLLDLFQGHQDRLYSRLFSS